MEQVFFNTSLGQLHTVEIINHIKSFLQEDPEGVYSLVIGTDSHQKMDEIKDHHSLLLVTAVVIYRHGYGARYFWKKKKVKNIHTLRDKIYAETLESLNFAKEFVPLLKKYVNGESPNYDLEIHVDVGEHGQTRDMIKEVVGMVTGSGFVARTKPNSFAASYVADKHT